MSEEQEIPIFTCVGCQHFHIELEGDFSDVTPGSGFQMYCMKDIYSLSGHDIDRREFEAALRNAETCGKFEARK